MKNKILALIPVFVLFSMVAGNAQNQVKAMIRRLEKSKMTLTFDMTVNGKEVLSGNKLTVQDDCFLLEMGKTSVYCDGKTKWIVDEENEELIVESVSGDDSGFGDNPSALFKKADSLFVISSPVPSDFNNAKVSCYTLTPKTEEKISAYKSVRFYFDKDILVGLFIKYSEKQHVSITVSNIRFSGKINPGLFRFDVKNLSKSWVITDDRES